jgi:hypothetical protein
MQGHGVAVVTSRAHGRRGDAGVAGRLQPRVPLLNLDILQALLGIHAEEDAVVGVADPGRVRVELDTADDLPVPVGWVELAELVLADAALLEVGVDLLLRAARGEPGQDGGTDRLRGDPLLLGDAEVLPRPLVRSVPVAHVDLRLR